MIKEETPDVFTKESLAEYLQISQGMIDKLVRQGKLKLFKVGTKCRYTKKAVEEYIEQSS